MSSDETTDPKPDKPDTVTANEDLEDVQETEDLNNAILENEDLNATVPETEGADIAMPPAEGEGGETPDPECATNENSEGDATNVENADVKTADATKDPKSFTSAPTKPLEQINDVKNDIMKNDPAAYNPSCRCRDCPVLEAARDYIAREMAEKASTERNAPDSQGELITDSSDPLAKNSVTVPEEIIEPETSETDPQITTSSEPQTDQIIEPQMNEEIEYQLNESTEPQTDEALNAESEQPNQVLQNGGEVSNTEPEIHESDN